MGMIKEFKEFAMRGNVLDLAVGVIMGAAFAPVVKSMVEDVIMPPIGWAVHGVDFSKLSIRIPAPGETPVEILYGKFLNAVFAFVVTAFAVFLIIKAINTFQKKKEEDPKPTKSELLLEEILKALKEQKKTT